MKGMQTIKVKIQIENGNVLDATIRQYILAPPSRKAGGSCLELTAEMFGIVKSCAHNYFDALIGLRRQLDPIGVRLLCFGARKDSWASGMQRDMGAGLVAYLLSSQDLHSLVQKSIFEYAPSETIGTVEEQREYAEKWFKRG